MICLIINRTGGSSRLINGNVGPDVLRGKSFCLKNSGWPPAGPAFGV